MNRIGKKAIPTDIIEDILLRLPVKTLLRLKSVCYNWRRLIGSQYFIDRHLRHESNPERLLCHSVTWGSIFFMNAADGDERRPPPHIKLPPMPNRNRILALVGPVKGVFCAVSFLGLVVLWNPATREIRQLPALLPLHYVSREIGFGSDPLSGDLKLVALHEGGSTPQNSACVYNLSRGDSWQPVEDADSLKSMSYVLGSFRRCCTFLNGVYHWLIELVNDGGIAILAFDMRTDKFQEILHLPDCLTTKRYDKLTIAAYGESLALLSRVRSAGGEYCVDLWVMGRDGFWTKNFTFGPFQHKMLPLRMWNKNEVLLVNLWTSTLILCHVSTHKLRKVGIEMLRCCVSAIFLYKESLASTKREGDRDDDGVRIARQIL